jgi:hypothetical protein
MERGAAAAGEPTPALLGEAWPAAEPNPRANPPSQPLCPGPRLARPRCSPPALSRAGLRWTAGSAVRRGRGGSSSLTVARIGQGAHRDHAPSLPEHQGAVPRGVVAGRPKFRRGPRPTRRSTPWISAWCPAERLEMATVASKVPQMQVTARPPAVPAQMRHSAHERLGAAAPDGLNVLSDARGLSTSGKRVARRGRVGARRRSVGGRVFRTARSAASKRPPTARTGLDRQLGHGSGRCRSRGPFQGLTGGPRERLTRSPRPTVQEQRATGPGPGTARRRSRCSFIVYFMF